MDRVNKTITKEWNSMIISDMTNASFVSNRLKFQGNLIINNAIVSDIFYTHQALRSTLTSICERQKRYPSLYQILVSGSTFSTHATKQAQTFSKCRPWYIIIYAVDSLRQCHRVCAQCDCDLSGWYTQSFRQFLFLIFVLPPLSSSIKEGLSLLKRLRSFSTNILGHFALHW